MAELAFEICFAADGDDVGAYCGGPLSRTTPRVFGGAIDAPRKYSQMGAHWLKTDTDSRLDIQMRQRYHGGNANRALGN